MTKQSDKKIKREKSDIWLPIKLRKISKYQLPLKSSRSDVEEKECKLNEQKCGDSTAKLDTPVQGIQDAKPSENLLTFFATSKLMSKTSVTLGGSSPYASISRRKASKHNEDLVDYYESCCAENDSVSSLPLLKTTHSFQPERKKCSSMPRFFTQSSSIAGDSLPSIFEEDPFAFLDEYETRDYPEYFLPGRKDTKACKQWLALESSGNYEKLDTTNDYCARPLCLIIGDERLPSTWLNVYPDLKSWF
ncbi:unnamed protein product [Orchesella dallaii]|uniref:Uncharacterized protein n=1 Tax=Orchesella dallaii TaxID=48710 RepID=A0ABP1QH18_9HEXA